MIRPFTANEWQQYRDLRLRALEDSPDAFGSTLAAEQPMPDEHWMTRLADSATSATDLPLVAELDDALVGLAWGRVDPPNSSTANLYQMWIAPEARGHGLGRMLLDEVVEWARSFPQVQEVALNVTCGDTPATRLYVRAGFKIVGDPKPLRKGSTVMAQNMVLGLRGAST